MIPLAFALIGVAGGLVVLGVVTDALGPLVAAVAVALVALLVLAVGVWRAPARQHPGGADAEVSPDPGAGEPEPDGEDGADGCGATGERGG